MLHKRQKSRLTDTKDKEHGAKSVASRSAGQLEQVPGFIYIAEVSPAGFHPKSCMGGFRKLTGYPPGRFLRSNFYDDSIVHPKDVESLRKFRFSTKSSAAPRNISYRIVTRQGKTINVLEQVSPIGSGVTTKLIGGSVTFSPKPNRSKTIGNTERDNLRFEEMERLNKHLLEVNQLKDEFLANTSHELRTPLNSIIGFLTLITEGYYENDDELRLFTRNALDSSYHLLNVINDLLDISKIESGRMQLQIEKVYVDELMEDVYSLFKVQADQKGLDLKCMTQDGPLFAAADIRKLKQVLINLAGNAIKFTAKGEIGISVEPCGAALRFSIKDSGIGIPREKQDKLFQKFIQVDGSATRRYGGSGLGLVISKHLVEMMGGEIRIESKGAGLGTTVSFTIPSWTKGDP